MRFIPSARGLHYYDTRQDAERIEAHATASEEAASEEAPERDQEPRGGSPNPPTVPTIAENARQLKATASDLRRAEKARVVEAVLGFPSPRDFKAMVRTQSLRNLDVTVADIDLASALYGPSLGALRGKSTRKRPGRAESWYIDVPRSLRERLRRVDLSVDVFFVAGMPHMVCRSRGIGFVQCAPLASRKKAVLVKKLKNMSLFYTYRGFHIRTAFMDGEFDALQGEFPFVMHIAGKDEHVGDIERLIRVIKERVRAILSTLPFKKVPKVILRYLI